MPPRKRKVSYPPPRTATRQAPPPGIVGGDPAYVRPTVVSIDVNAASGRSGLSIGDRVRINGGGLYSGEIATIERFAGGVIPAAVVRTDAGKSRQVRTIDLEPVGRETARETPREPSAGPAPEPTPREA